MKGQNLRFFTVFLFLAFLFTSKLAGFHALTHDCDPVHELHCVICDLAVASQHTPALPTEAPVLVEHSVDIPVQQPTIYQADRFFDQAISPDQLFGRPPPGSLL